ncbi:MAG TPA: RraA family protein [Prolixibacteraceae bacterium]|nr:RraA family protein [Prolixibacteraceae bacterium]
MLPLSDLLKLKRWNTPTIYNGWEQISKRRRTTGFNIEETKDFMPEFGPMIGYAVTVKIKPSEPATNPNAWAEYRTYIASLPGPKIIVMQDMDKPNTIGSFWGEVSANTHKTLGCVGVIVDGAIRDLDEMKSTGFKALARRLCVGHAYAAPISWGEPVEVFGTIVNPGDLIHADKHGFLIIPEEDQPHILEASLFMDNNECDTVIKSALVYDRIDDQIKIVENMNESARAFSKAAVVAFGKEGEWK